MDTKIRKAEITASGPLPLSAELRALEAEFPAWHCWVSDAGVIHATSCTCPFGGSGTTLEAPNPQRMRQVITAQLREWSVAA